MKSPCIIATICLLSITNPAVAEEVKAKTISYNNFSAGYLWGDTDEELLTDADGVILSAQFEPFDRIVISGAYEHTRFKFDDRRVDLNFTDQAFVATIGTYVPISEQLHFTFDVGIDYEVLKGSGSAIGPDDNDKEIERLANVVVGIRTKPMDKLELSASLQRLYDLRGDGSWVSRINVAYAITDQVDIGATFNIENDLPAIAVGARYRF